MLKFEAVVVGFDNVPRELVFDVLTVGLLLAQLSLDISISLAEPLDFRHKLGNLRVFFVGESLEGRALLSVVDSLAVEAVLLGLCLMNFVLEVFDVSLEHSIFVFESAH